MRLTGFVVVAALVIACSAPTTPAALPSLPTTELQCLDCPVVTVSRIIDGDTFDSSAGRVRLFGVDAPERGEKCFGEATDRLRELAGRAVRVENGPRAADGYNRLLYYVYTGYGDSIDEALVREGLAEAWTRDGQHRDYLVDLEREAMAEGVGCLW